MKGIQDVRRGLSGFASSYEGGIATFFLRTRNISRLAVLVFPQFRTLRNRPICDAGLEVFIVQRGSLVVTSRKRQCLADQSQGIRIRSMWRNFTELLQPVNGVRNSLSGCGVVICAL